MGWILCLPTKMRCTPLIVLAFMITFANTYSSLRFIFFLNFVTKSIYLRYLSKTTQSLTWLTLQTIIHYSLPFKGYAKDCSEWLPA